jgi:RNA polymerase sigma-70 factor, ECF subfamily
LYKIERPAIDEQLFGLFQNNVRELDCSTQRNLFLAYRELVYRIIYLKLNDRSLTEDVVQEGFIKAMKAGPRTQHHSNLKAWLMQITLRTTIDFIRKNKKYHLFSDLESVITNKGSESLNSTDEIVEKMLKND